MLGLPDFLNNCYVHGTLKNNEVLESELNAEEILDAEYHITQTM